MSLQGSSTSFLVRETGMIGKTFARGVRGDRRHRHLPHRPDFRAEPLESRTLLHAVFDPIFGAETQKQDDSDGKMFRPPLNIVFWGREWVGNNPTDDPNQWDSALSPRANALLGALDQLIHSPYFNLT